MAFQPLHLHKHDPLRIMAPYGVVAANLRNAELSDEEKTAYARLFAAAPDLLAALEDAVAFLDELNWGGEERGARMDKLRAAIIEAKAA